MDIENQKTITLLGEELRYDPSKPFIPEGGKFNDIAKVVELFINENMDDNTTLTLNNIDLKYFCLAAIYAYNKREKYFNKLDKLNKFRNTVDELNNNKFKNYKITE